MKKKFNAIGFLRDLVDDIAATERAGKEFVADPSMLGPRLLSVQNELALLTLHYDALKKRSWQVRQSDDLKWRVCSPEIQQLAILDGQQAGSDSAEEALDEAILRCALRVNTE